LTADIDRLVTLMRERRYVADREIAMAIHLAMRLGKPLLVEGHAGVGKTEIAKTLAEALGTNLIRLQCYEGLDSASALYEWNYPRQLLHLKAAEGGDLSTSEREQELFGTDYLMKRPLLEAILQRDKAPVLLIDEVDRADEEFEAFLLEVLAEWQVTIPELGTLTAQHRPYVVLTSNRVRELSDALQRRCLYLWIDYPSYDREVEIVHVRIPDVPDKLAEEVCRFVRELRRLPLEKAPGVAETLDWASALIALGAAELDEEAVAGTLGAVLKSRDDIIRVRSDMAALLAVACPAG
jgi:MoxR-like ATPase